MLPFISKYFKLGECGGGGGRWTVFIVLTLVIRERFQGYPCELGIPILTWRVTLKGVFAKKRDYRLSAKNHRW